MELGVFYICYKEKDAVEVSLRKFREIYPGSPIYLTSDNGTDFSYLKTEFSNIQTIFEDSEVVGYTPAKIDADIANKTINYEFYNNRALEFLRRLKAGCDYCNTDYVLLMEPDVYVRGKLTMPSADLVGPTVNIMPLHIQQYILSVGGKNNGTWGPSGGIMRRSAFNDVYTKISSNPDILHAGLSMDPRILSYDYLLAFLFSAYGYTYTENPEHTECLRNPNWKLSNHKILHQYREHYKKGANYEGKWKEN